MGPFDDYGDMRIITRKTDVAVEADNKPRFASVLIGLLLALPTYWTLCFMGLYLIAHIGVIAPSGIIGLGFWACAYYGTNHSVLDRFRYRTTKIQRAIISRRLSGQNKISLSS